MFSRQGAKNAKAEKRRDLSQSRGGAGKIKRWGKTTRLRPPASRPERSRGTSLPEHLAKNAKGISEDLAQNRRGAGKSWRGGNRKVEPRIARISLMENQPCPAVPSSAIRVIRGSCFRIRIFHAKVAKGISRDLAQRPLPVRPVLFLIS